MINSITGRITKIAPDYAYILLPSGVEYRVEISSNASAFSERTGTVTMSLNMLDSFGLRLFGGGDHRAGGSLSRLLQKLLFLHLLLFGGAGQESA